MAAPPGKRRSIPTVAVPILVIAVVAMLVIPLPTWVLDLLISANIAAAVVVLLTAMQVSRPLDFSVFPTLLLIATMFRLALNVSVTRLVLLHGYAGSVIESFGHFVVGGSLLVGLVVFLILIVIQFVVITNGAGRVAEVAARFTLDAMPGKQMAIDADLHAGLIDDVTARRRRQEVADEADFYGAMDGASKFVKGDAIAALVIVVVNLVGGLATGVLVKHEPISQAIRTYSLLSIGDGLVSQIPALLLSLSTGIIVTRAATEQDLGQSFFTQLGRHKTVVRAAGVVMLVLAAVPGLPKIPFVVVGAGVVLVAGRLPGAGGDGIAEPTTVPAADLPDRPEALAAETRIEPLELELGVAAIDLVDRDKGGDLLSRVRALRKSLARELGLVIPPVHTRDNLDLPAATYRIRVHGVDVGEGEVPPGRLLALGRGIETLPGEPTTDPAFGGPARWIGLEQRHLASVLGATVVDRSSVVTTHLAEVARTHAAELLSRQDVKVLLDGLKLRSPAVVEEMATASVGLSDVHGVLRGLLEEQVAIRDLGRIVEAVTDQARVARDPDSLLEAARLVLGPAICAALAEDGRLSVLTVDPLYEADLLQALRNGERGRILGVPPSEAAALVAEVLRLAREAESGGSLPALLSGNRLRLALRRLISPSLPRMAFVAVGEVGRNLVLVPKGVLNRVDAAVRG